MRQDQLLQHIAAIVQKYFQERKKELSTERAFRIELVIITKRLLARDFEPMDPNKDECIIWRFFNKIDKGLFERFWQEQIKPPTYFSSIGATDRMIYDQIERTCVTLSIIEFQNELYEARTRDSCTTTQCTL